MTSGQCTMGAMKKRRVWVPRQRAVSYTHLAVEALMGLGYQKAEALSAVSAVRELADTTEELTLLALKRLGM